MKTKTHIQRHASYTPPGGAPAVAVCGVEFPTMATDPNLATCIACNRIWRGFGAPTANRSSPPVSYVRTHLHTPPFFVKGKPMKPLLLFSDLTGSVYICTRYRVQGKTVIAQRKYDVTDQIPNLLKLRTRFMRRESAAKTRRGLAPAPGCDGGAVVHSVSTADLNAAVGVVGITPKKGHHQP